MYILWPLSNSLFNVKTFQNFDLNCRPQLHYWTYERETFSSQILAFISANSATTNTEENEIIEVRLTKSGEEIEMKEGGISHVFLCHVHDREN